MKSRSIARVPLIGYLYRLIIYVVKLPIKFDEQQNIINLLESQNKENQKIVDQIVNDLHNTGSRMQNISINLDRLSKMTMLFQETKKVDTKNSTKERFADNHLLDLFYTNFEDKFRGDENTIITRLKEHVPIFRDSSINFDKYPVLDIGCGRGEFLRLLKEEGINAIGLDMNIDMVNRSIDKGLKVTQGDAINFLNKANPQSFGAVTGFHIVEHIPFDQLLQIFNDAYSSLVEDGFVLFETPNPENIIVGSCSFYTDPSHLKPIPPELLQFALESVGFTKTKIIRLHPDINRQQKLSKDINYRFYGPRDYAVLGYK